MIKQGTAQHPTDQQIAEFEARLGYELPQDYKDFLRSEGTGVVAYFNEVTGFDADVAQFNDLVPRKRNAMSIEMVMELLGGALPLGVMPFAHDSGGAKFCLILSGALQGSVAHYDTQFDYDEDRVGRPAIDQMRVIAPSFTAFIQRVVPDEL